MTHDTAKTRPGAIALGVILTALTAWVTTTDVHALADLSPAHALTFAAIALAIYSGHTALPLIRDGRSVLGAGFIVLAIATTGYVAAVSGMRNTSGVESKARAASERNAQRSASDIKVLDAQRDHAEAKAEEKALCRNPGVKCERKTRRTEAAWSHLLITEALRDKLGPIEDAQAGYRAFAELLALLPGVHAAQASIERGLVLGLPWLVVIITEIGTIMCWSVGLARSIRAELDPGDASDADLAEVRKVFAPRSAAATTSIAAPRARVTKPRPPVTAAQRQRIEQYVLTETALGRSIASQVAIADALRLPTSTVSDVVRDMERSGLIVRRVEGRAKVIAGV